MHCNLCTKAISDDQHETDQVLALRGEISHRACVEIARPRVDKGICGMCGKNPIIYVVVCEACRSSPNPKGF